MKAKNEFEAIMLMELQNNCERRACCFFQLMDADTSVLKLNRYKPREKKIYHPPYKRNVRERIVRQKPVIISPEDFFEQHKKCYKKEARAIIEGKHWQGKNKCVTLPGDNG